MKSVQSGVFVWCDVEYLKIFLAYTPLPTLVVLELDGWKCLFNVKNTHPDARLKRAQLLPVYSVLRVYFEYSEYEQY